MYHYTESGLSNVWLANGFIRRQTPYGAAVSIRNADALHQTIAMSLVTDKPRWSGGEFRFVRKELDMSQATLGSVIGKDAQTIARWEKSGRVPKMADRFMRVLYREKVGGNEKVRELIEKLNQLDQQRHERMLFEAADRSWRLRAA
jgi:DNA-binding transcriptional regulator YiaG